MEGGKLELGEWLETKIYTLEPSVSSFKLSALFFFG